MRGDRLAQRLVARRRLVVGEPVQRLPCVACDQARPDLIWKQVQRWLAGAKDATRAALDTLGIPELLERAHTRSEPDGGCFRLARRPAARPGHMFAQECRRQV